ncbi:hypothetical protein PtrSN002B_003091 [Pyrenophora tritici-repentis]|uniref:Uncharacterized protein n=2 Tax=Pyrenophora tritici-repentis TaxID=45151 RepID=A0A2W1G965_9PLEO|nr:uncharacterized protein PTRG_05960 [Pyrenophora tritici-repentis Pt-1C-BFP]KAA8619084.1 hypothetical protein PtrV1_08513 [Pyrenophora tritici-repentis]EDU48880.1 conserved hypothetical protein [Pyrenophora tritici-repentis Pt-1C-BFP]KAF7449550.1 hypothetical protein A1F99_065990 [Pyrenophora tritici-repentis]KAF7570337.1 hypothetical protein PtrM4_103390 [Pyrenophora tritici-repentis]KAG9383511.1 hypothetical protein A1F94_005422 [Pyrenophora tritici-repentis]
MGVRYRLKDSVKWEPDYEIGIKCPYCETVVGAYTEDPLLCKKCLEWFQFYVVRCDEILSYTSGLGAAITRLREPVAPANKKRPRIEDSEDEDDPRIFKRVAYMAIHLTCTGGSVEMENRDPSDVELYSTKQPRITQIIDEPSDE